MGHTYTMVEDGITKAICVFCEQMVIPYDDLPDPYHVECCPTHGEA